MKGTFATQVGTAHSPTSCTHAHYRCARPSRPPNPEVSDQHQQAITLTTQVVSTHSTTSPTHVHHLRACAPQLFELRGEQPASARRHSYHLEGAAHSPISPIHVHYLRAYAPQPLELRGGRPVSASCHSHYQGKHDAQSGLTRTGALSARKPPPLSPRSHGASSRHQPTATLTTWVSTAHSLHPTHARALFVRMCFLSSSEP